MGAKVLIADDSESMRQLLTFTLTTAGYDVVAAIDGQDALGKLDESDDFDIVVTDLRMPNVDGLGVVRGTRAHPDHRFKPILLLTTESLPSWKEQARSAGASGWITKPFRPEQLLDAVERLVGK